MEIMVFLKQLFGLVVNCIVVFGISLFVVWFIWFVFSLVNYIKYRINERHEAKFTITKCNKNSFEYQLDEKQDKR